MLGLRDLNFVRISHAIQHNFFLGNNEFRNPRGSTNGRILNPVCCVRGSIEHAKVIASLKAARSLVI